MSRPNDAYYHILRPTEADPESGPVVDFAVGLADRWGTSLTVLSVVEDTAGVIADRPVDERRGQLSAKREDAIEGDEAAAEDLEGPVQTAVGMEKPEQSIPRTSTGSGPISS